MFVRKLSCFGAYGRSGNKPDKSTSNSTRR